MSKIQVLNALSSVKMGKAVGPDYKILKEFALELTPVSQDIFNSSMSEGYFPDLLKTSLVNPIPNVSTLINLHMQAIYEVVDMGNCGMIVFFCGFFKRVGSH